MAFHYRQKSRAKSAQRQRRDRRAQLRDAEDMVAATRLVKKQMVISVLPENHIRT
jgi:hypothetical protein